MAKPVPKKPVKKYEPPSKGEVVKAKSTAPVSATLEEAMEADAGKGVSSLPQDNLVPIMAVVQDKTPEADKNNSRYIKGVEGGMFWLKNASDPFVPGEEGVVVQHCHSYKAIVEWRPRAAGGGLVAQHPHDDDFKAVIRDAKQIPDPMDPNKTKWVRPNGNDLIDTRYEVVRVFREDGSRLQYVIPFTSTGHTVAKGWNTLRGTFHTKSGAMAPSFSRLYRLTTKAKSNQKGTWFLISYEDEGPIQTLEEYQAGLALHNAFNKGEKKVDTSTLGDEAAPANDDM